MKKLVVILLLSAFLSPLFAADIKTDYKNWQGEIAPAPEIPAQPTSKERIATEERISVLESCVADPTKCPTEDAAKPAGSHPHQPASSTANHTQKTTLPAAATAKETKNTKSAKQGDRPYFSVGLPVMRSKASFESKIGTTSSSDSLSKNQTGARVAFGSQVNPNLRMEVFFQYRTPFKYDENIAGVSQNIEANMWDLGFAMFVTPNPDDKVQFSLGGGIALTRVSPKWKVNNKRVDMFSATTNPTPMLMVGLGFPDKNGDVALDITGFWARTIINEESGIVGAPSAKITLKNITSYGVVATLRFNL